MALYAEAEYDRYYDNSVIYSKSTASINGQKCSYKEFETWIDSFEVVQKVNGYSWNNQRSDMTLEEILFLLQSKDWDNFPNAESDTANTTRSFNMYFADNYSDNILQMCEYESAAQGILRNSSTFQINWNSCLSALSNKDFIDAQKFDFNPEYYYQTVLLEAIMQTKLNDNYWSALMEQTGQIAIDALSYYVKYDANYTSYEQILKQKLNTAMTDFRVDSVQYKRLSEYYGQYCKQLESYDIVKSIYDLTTEADGTVEDFFQALSNYSSIQGVTEETISALKYLRDNIEISTEEDQYIKNAINNILSSFDRTLERQLVLNCMESTKDLLFGVFWAAIGDACSGILKSTDVFFLYDFFNAGVTLSNTLFPTTISSNSYCKIYADYAIEIVTGKVMEQAYIGYAENPSEELATTIVGLYDLLGYTYAHEIEVASVLSEQLHKDGLINGLKNLFSSKNMNTYEYEQDCIKAYAAYLNEVLSVKVAAQTEYGLTVGSSQPVITVYMVNGKVVSANEIAVNTGDVPTLASGVFPFPDFVDLRLEIGGYYLDQKMSKPYEEKPVIAPLSLYCNLLLTKASDGTPVLMDHATGIAVSCEDDITDCLLKTEWVASGKVYDAVTNHFKNAAIALYDIALTQNGGIVQPSDTVTVEIPIDTAYRNGSVSVFHVDEDGEFVNMNAEYSDQKVRFQTSHFSYYVIIYEKTSINWVISTIAIVAACGMVVFLFYVFKGKRRRQP